MGRVRAPAKVIVLGVDVLFEDYLGGEDRCKKGFFFFVLAICEIHGRDSCSNNFRLQVFGIKRIVVIVFSARSEVLFECSKVVGGF